MRAQLASRVPIGEGCHEGEYPNEAGTARGFTLIELILVLFILTLVAGLALPAVGRGVDLLQLRAEVATFSAFLRYARQQAITRREPHEVTINPQAHLLTLRVPRTGTERASRRLSPRIAIRVEAPIGRSITFSRRGLSGGGTFRLVGAQGRAYQVRLHPLTGRVTNTRDE